MPSPAHTLLLAFVSAWFLLGGLSHFVFTDFFVGIVPPYMPQPLATVQVSGIFELLGAAALLVSAQHRLAACGLFILTLCVTPTDLYMWQYPDLFPSFPPTLLTTRLTPQAFFLGYILALILVRDGAPLTQHQARARESHCARMDSGQEYQEMEEQSDLTWIGQWPLCRRPAWLLVGFVKKYRVKRPTDRQCCTRRSARGSSFP